MLVLTRRTQQSVVLGVSGRLGHTITVTVLRVRGGEVRLGFECPTHILIQRMEVWERARSPSCKGEGHPGEDPNGGSPCRRIPA
jgi:carbon storage regulator CsrA